ncbi:MAG: hypothetical protein NC191_04840 [Muribaculaceae bacterium]|nr:hypothetical protein [Muribaculaceae bacterium]
MITVGIIGVVAAITIPNLMTAHKAHKLRAQFLKSYSTIQQIIRQMEDDGISTNPKDYGLNSSGEGFPKEFAKYLNAPTICSNNVSGNVAKTAIGCLSYKIDKDYKCLNSNIQLASGQYNDGQILLQDGSLIFFDDGFASEGWKGRIIIVDLNNYEGQPNMLGYDVFIFENVNGNIYTMGDQNTDWRGTKYNADTYCNFSGTQNLNGITCAQKAKDDTDYFKKAVKKIKARK